MKIEEVYKALYARKSINHGDIQWLHVIFYDLYLQGIEEGKQQIKDQMHRKLDTLLGDD